MPTPEQIANTFNQEWTLVVHGDEVIALQVALLFAYENGHAYLDEKAREQIKAFSSQITRTK